MVRTAVVPPGTDRQPVLTQLREPGVCMPQSLSATLLDPARRPSAVNALTGVIDAEVAGKGGLGGAAVRAGYAAAKKLGGNFVPSATDRLLPQFADALEPFWAERGDRPFGDHLAAQPDAVADALLAVTDGKAERTSHAAAARVYGALRAKAKEHVIAALPRLGAALEDLAA
jgi:hypothetical protein